MTFCSMRKCSMPNEDLIRIRHILDAAGEAQRFIHDRTRSTLDRDQILVLALVRLIEVIGEAAAHISKEFQDAHPEVPWTQMIAMRNRLVHAYFDVDLDRVWDTVTDDLPPLVAMLERFVPRQS